MNQATAKEEIAKGERFAFGENWTRFLEVLDDERIHFAEQSLLEMLEVDNLNGKSFIDIGSGSGLFSLAARRLGARVLSFDFDPHSVACGQELKRRYFPDDENWEVRHGSALDAEWLASLGQWDIVYSWGVLHHTGAMWDALANVAPLAKDGGQLFIAIYNDQGPESKQWKRIKAQYSNGGALTRRWLTAKWFWKFFWRMFAADLVRHGNPKFRWNQYGKCRGMSRMHDLVDWIGGYPFEVARPEEIFDFYRAHGFALTKMITCGGGLGCNQFVFQKTVT